MSITITIEAESGAMAAVELRNLTLGLMGQLSMQAVPAQGPVTPTGPVNQPSVETAVEPELVPEEAEVEEPVKKTRKSRAKKAKPVEVAPTEPEIKTDEPAAPEVQKVAAEKAEEQKPAEGEEITLGFVTARLTELSTKKDLDTARDLLAKMGVERMGELPKERYQEFLAEIDTLIGDVA